jgi:hypothetical protein
MKKYFLILAVLVLGVAATAFTPEEVNPTSTQVTVEGVTLNLSPQESTGELSMAYLVSDDNKYIAEVEYGKTFDKINEIIAQRTHSDIHTPRSVSGYTMMMYADGSKAFYVVIKDSKGNAASVHITANNAIQLLSLGYKFMSN